MRFWRKKKVSPLRLDDKLFAEYQFNGELYLLTAIETTVETFQLTFETARSVHERFSLRLDELRALEGQL